MLKVGVGNKDEVHALHNLAERLEQRRVEVDIPSAVQQDRHAADLINETIGGSEWDGLSRGGVAEGRESLSVNGQQNCCWGRPCAKKQQKN